MDWNDGWPLGRVLVLLVSCLYLVTGAQVWMFHYRQNFHHKIMYAPVVAAPILFLCGLLLALFPADWLAVLFGVLMGIGIVSGLVGFYFHFRGVGIRVGGYELRNFLIGPPIVLPLLFSALGVLGLLAVLMS